MYFMYVDESGDVGLVNSPTEFFVLSGLVVHESDWRTFIDTLVKFRSTMREVYGLPVRHEIHASAYISSAVFDIKRHNRLAILRNLLDELAKQPYLSITNVVVRKRGKMQDYDIFDAAWKTLFQRFENTLKFGNFPGAHRNDHGLVITDMTDGKKLTRLVRKMSKVNFIPNMMQFGRGTRNIPMLRIIEDPFGKDSSQTLPIQAVDVVSYFLMQSIAPNSYIRRQGAKSYLSRLDPILNKRASTTHPQGIVLL